MKRGEGHCKQDKGGGYIGHHPSQLRNNQLETCTKDWWAMRLVSEQLSHRVLGAVPVTLSRALPGPHGLLFGLSQVAWKWL